MRQLLSKRKKPKSENIDRLHFCARCSGAQSNHRGEKKIRNRTQISPILCALRDRVEPILPPKAKPIPALLMVHAEATFRQATRFHHEDVANTSCCENKYMCEVTVH